MEKMNRELTQIQLKNSKSKNIDAVMDNVYLNEKKSVFNIFIMSPKYVAVFASILIIVLTVIFVDFGDKSTPITTLNEIVLDDSTTETLVELSYMSASLMSNSFTISNDTFLQLAKPDSNTSIGADIEELNSYFDMLKVFLEENPFQDNIITEELIDEEYQTKITFSSEGKNFEFFINIIEENIEGILYIDETMYTVQGKQVIEETESKLQLKAMNGNDYVEVEYKSNSEELETTQKYKVETSLNGVLTEKSIKVTFEEGSYKVTIEDLTSKYNLKINTEDDLAKYMLDYTIDGEKGKAKIYLDVDEFDNPVYRYEIREANLTETIIIPIPTVITEEQSVPNTEKTEKNYTL